MNAGAAGGFDGLGQHRAVQTIVATAETGEVTNEQTAEFLVGYLEAFGALVDRYASVPVAA